MIELPPVGACPYKIGDEVRCIDDTNGANFLKFGQVYTIDHIQRGVDGKLAICLAGMARAWPPTRFVLA